MLPHLTGWTRASSGESLVYAPDDARDAGWIRCVEGLAPPRRLRAIVEAALGDEPRLLQPVVSRPKPIVTHEGEFGALVTISGSVDEAPARRHLGVVFSDRFYDLIASLVVRQAAFARFEAAVATLTTEDSLGLGVRRRRFWYDAPPGWDGLRRGLATEWTPPGFPCQRALAVVLPAEPAGASDDELLEKLVEAAETNGFSADEARGPFDAGSDHGLSGSWWTVSGTDADRVPHIREIVLLRDARYVYIAHLEATDAAHAAHFAAFQKLTRSIRGLPLPRKKE